MIRPDELAGAHIIGEEPTFTMVVKTAETT